MKQLHDRAVFQLIHVDDLTEEERKRAMESLIFLVEKRDGTCANGSTQRAYTERDDAASPTAMTESILITAALCTKRR